MQDDNKTNTVLLLAGATFVVGVMAGITWALRTCIRSEQELVARAVREALSDEF